ncbi:MAG: RluA family pseudouridine synthase [Cyanobacteria bacterium Co-bin8]|nr:RluA family pseudouridine synthase [Cyanobacteria bacterium Co-bin8]
MLHPLTAFIASHTAVPAEPPDYWYEGRCPYTGQILRLPRTKLARAIAHALMAQLAAERGSDTEGKMYGVLLVKNSKGDQAVLKAFSGLLEGQSQVEGWVPPIPGREQVACEEAKTLAALDQIKQRLIALQQLPEREKFRVQSQEFEARLKALTQVHRQRKQQRQAQRQQIQSHELGTVVTDLAALDEQSRQDGLERRRLKQKQAVVLGPLKDAIAAADSEILALKRQRKDLSRRLQAQMHETYRLTNFAGQSQSIDALAQSGLPTGTGDCCAPKLLQYAATQGLMPLAMAEFWWGRPSASGDKLPRQFYGACEDRCQPIMGFLLAGLSPRLQPLAGAQEPAPGATSLAVIQSPSPFSAFHSLPILYEDEWLIAIDKPAGLLSVPGRYLGTQDSVLSRLRHSHPKGDTLIAVHRLDQDTSGVLLLACDPETGQHLNRQFQQRQVQKTYEAVLEGTIKTLSGLIDLPLWADPQDRPRQKVDWQKGKPSLTRFQVVPSADRLENSLPPAAKPCSKRDTLTPTTRIEFFPITGRTHQLRVHAADPAGLGAPIRGDRIYGTSAANLRLHLHARELRFHHPHTNSEIHLSCPTPF